MHIFYLDEIPQGQTVKINDIKELHHMINVLRVNPNEIIEIIYGRGSMFSGVVDSINPKQAILNIKERKYFDRNNVHFSLTVACSLIKTDKMELAVENLTELGVDKIIFLETERSQLKIKEFEKKIDRLKKISIFALKQSANIFLPKIEFMIF